MTIARTLIILSTFSFLKALLEKKKANKKVNKKEIVENFNENDLDQNVVFFRDDLRNNWNSGKGSYLENINYDEAAPEDFFSNGDDVISFTMKDNVGYFYDYGDNASQQQNESYEISIYAKTDAGLLVTPYTADNTEAGDNISRVWLSGLKVESGEGWKKLVWTFRNHQNSVSNSLSFKLTGGEGVSRHALFRPEMRRIITFNDQNIENHEDYVPSVMETNLVDERIYWVIIAILMVVLGFLFLGRKSRPQLLSPIVP